MKIKRITSAVCALVLAAGCAGVSELGSSAVLRASAAETGSETTVDIEPKSGTCGENLVWMFDGEETLTIIGTGEMDNYTWNTVPWSKERQYITKVVIQKGVTSIGACAFIECGNTESITIPNTITSIGAAAFVNCKSLTEITIPASVTRIDGSAFSGCTSLESIAIPKSVVNIDSWVFANCTGLKSVNIQSGVKSIGEWAFNGCKNLEKVTIPDTVTSIGERAFSECTSLTDIAVPGSVNSIGESAFYSCTSLESITIPKGVANIGYGAFALCSGLTSVTIPESVKSIGSIAFQGCTSLTSVSIPGSVKSLSESVFSGCTSLESIVIPDGVTSIGKYAFYNCTSLESAAVPESVTEIGEYAFNGCKKLADITISENVSGFGENALVGTAWLDNKYSESEDHLVIVNNILIYGGTESGDVIIPDSVNCIGEGAFTGCVKLKSVTIPESVKSIGKRAFAGCKNLEGITVPKSVESIGGSAFMNTARNFILYCYKDSVAAQYAEDNKLTFDLVDVYDIVNPVITAVPSTTSATLSWKTVKGAQKYAVAVKVDGKWNILEKIKDTSYVLRGLKEGENYDVAVIAMFDGKWNDDFSNAVTVTTKTVEVTKYPMVTDTVYNEQYHQFRLTWSEVEGATEYGIAVRLAGKWKVQVYTDKTYFTSPKLKPGSEYEMVICAKVGGKWNIDKLAARAFKVTVK